MLKTLYGAYIIKLLSWLYKNFIFNVCDKWLIWTPVYYILGFNNFLENNTYAYSKGPTNVPGPKPGGMTQAVRKQVTPEVKA